MEQMVVRILIGIFNHKRMGIMTHYDIDKSILRG